MWAIPNLRTNNYLSFQSMPEDPVNLFTIPDYYWWKKHSYFHKLETRYINQIAPLSQKVLAIGFAQGHLIESLDFQQSLYIDIESRFLPYYRKTLHRVEVLDLDIESTFDIATIAEKGPFDLILLPDTLSYASDIQETLSGLLDLCSSETRVLISNHSRTWEPILKVAEFFSWKRPSPQVNFLGPGEIKNFLHLAGYEVVSEEHRMLSPVKLFGIGIFLNRFIAWLPVVRRLCLRQYTVARRAHTTLNQPLEQSVSLVIPCKNEKGNIEPALKRIPNLNVKTEIIFVEGSSNDGTAQEIVRQINLFPEKNIKFIRQSGKGKGNAVREAFRRATGDVLIILDGDLTVPPETMGKFIDAIYSGKGEFINGTRLVYRREEGSMMMLNLIANRFFASTFSFLLNQRLTDTLCGTKVIRRADFLKIDNSTLGLGELDPFGDFELILGAHALNLRFLEIPIRYDKRHYGVTQISRFRHGWLLLRITLIFFARLKWI